MRKIVSIALALVMVVTLAVPAFAAEPKKTLEERAAAITETYGVGVYIARDMGSYKFTQKDLAVTEKILTNLETALSLVGSSFMKKIDAVFAEQRKGTGFGNHDMNNKEIKGFAIIIMGYDGRPFGYDEHQASINDYALHLTSYGLGSQQPISVQTILEMLGFAFTARMMDASSHGTFNGQKYGTYNGNGSIPAGFISAWGTKSYANDYSSVFAYLITNNDKNPLPKNSVLWNKGKTVYDDLVKYMGTGARATQRAAANLGIEIPKTK